MTILLSTSGLHNFKKLKVHITWGEYLSLFPSGKKEKFLKKWLFCGRVSRTVKHFRKRKGRKFVGHLKVKEAP